MRRRVEIAREVQKERYKGTDILCNAYLTPAQVREYCALGKKESELMQRIFTTLGLTGRSYMKILKVARTIADFEGEERISAQHLSEAAGYRMIDRRVWGGQ